MRRLAVLLLAALVLAPPLARAASVHTSLTDPALVKRFHEISRRLVCQCGCNLVLDDCNHFNCGSATPMRARIDRELLAGKSNQEIINGFVEDMGLVVLAAPPTTGFNLTAWIAPGVILSLAVVVVVLLLRRWRTLPAAAPAAPAAPGPEEGGHSEEIEAELREL